MSVRDRKSTEKPDIQKDFENSNNLNEVTRFGKKLLKTLNNSGTQSKDSLNENDNS